MLGGIGTGELILIISVLVVLFGKKRTTEIAKDIGEASKEFRRVGKNYEDVVSDLQKPLPEEKIEPEPQKTGADLDHNMIASAKSNPKGGEENG